MDLISKDDGTREQTTEMYEKGLDVCFSKLSAEGKASIQAIGVSGQQHGFVPLDADGKPLYNIKLWNDTSTAEECKVLTDALGGKEKVVEAVQNFMLPGFTAPKIFWLKRHKPDAFAKKIVRTLFPDAPFSEVFGKRDGFERKPSPDGAQSIMELLSCQKEECVYIGDSDVDVQTARNAGIAFCGVSWGFRSREELQKEGAAFIADDPDDIIRYVMSR